jgi:hypothetical protein
VNARRRIANILRRVAARLDGDVPAVTTTPDGGYEIDFRGVPLARVRPGTVVTSDDITGRRRRP